MNCDHCLHRGKSGGVAPAMKHACFNKKSKHYMQTVWNGHPKCECFEFNAKGATK